MSVGVFNADLAVMTVFNFVILYAFALHTITILTESVTVDIGRVQQS